jgi:RNA polymerase sigma-70 factor (ECF subfamily)
MHESPAWVALGLVGCRTAQAFDCFGVAALSHELLRIRCCLSMSGNLPNKPSNSRGSHPAGSGQSASNFPGQSLGTGAKAPSSPASTERQQSGTKHSSGSQRLSPKAAAERGAIDKALMERVAANDEWAIAELYDRFGSLVFRMAFQTLPTKAEAEDAVQEIFVRLWMTAGRYDQERAALVTWVMLISRRHLVDKLRRTKARIRASSLDHPQATTVPIAQVQNSRMESDERVAVLMKRIDSLPELQRIVVTRAYLGGQTLRQIGDELNTPLGTIKSALSRALVRLRERAGEETTS